MLMGYLLRNSCTRVNNNKLYITLPRTNLNKKYFSHRIGTIWNSLNATIM